MLRPDEDRNSLVGTQTPDHRGGVAAGQGDGHERHHATEHEPGDDIVREMRTGQYPARGRNQTSQQRK